MRIEFRTDNAAFDERPQDEIIWILTHIGRLIEEEGMTEGKIRDLNGNTIGDWEL